MIIEGVDTCGKSTQIELLKKQYPKAIFTKEPGGTPLGVQIRSLVLDGDIKSKTAELFLFLADRAEHFSEVIKPNEDNLIISDRGFISGVSYALSFDFEMLIGLNKIALQGCFPDKVIFLKLGEDELLRRLSLKSHDKIESRGIEYLLQIQERIESVICGLGLNALILDASDKVENINKQIINFLEE